MNRKEKPILLWGLIACLIILAIGGLYGGVSFITDPSGSSIGMSTNILNNLPIRNYFLPGIFLIVAFSILPLMAIFGIFIPLRYISAIEKINNMRWGWTLSLTTGIILISWMILQLFLIGYQHPIQAFTLILGILIFVLSLNKGVMQYFKK